MPKGSVLSYQMALFESDFAVVADFRSIVPDSSDFESFPDFVTTESSLHEHMHIPLKVRQI